MQWHSIRKKYPHTWLLIEAITAHTEGELRLLDDINVVDSFHQSTEAMKKYQEMHRRDPHREFYVVHTDRNELNIKERKWVGIRSDQAA